jgi:hypothetical protein
MRSVGHQQVGSAGSLAIWEVFSLRFLSVSHPVYGGLVCSTRTISGQLPVIHVNYFRTLTFLFLMAVRL